MGSILFFNIQFYKNLILFLNYTKKDNKRFSIKQTIIRFIYTGNILCIKHTHLHTRARSIIVIIAIDQLLDVSLVKSSPSVCENPDWSQRSVRYQLNVVS